MMKKLTMVVLAVILALNFFASSCGTPSGKIAGYESARRILGNDFITPAEIAAANNRISYTKKQLSRFAKTLPAESMLLWAKENGYAVVAGPPAPLSLLDIRSLKPELFFRKDKNWYADDNFAKNDKATANWLIIKKEPVLNSLERDWYEQLPLISKDEAVPNVGEMSWFITSFYEVMGIRLFEGNYVRTSSITWRGRHVNAGNFNEYGLNIKDEWGDSRGEFIGLAAKKLTSSK